MIRFLLITNDPLVAEYAENSGVGRIFIDLETMGKQQRQGHLDTLISSHKMEDVAKVKAKLSTADLLVRLNPLYSNTKSEVDAAIRAGADWLMLPMFRSAGEVAEFSHLVAGRAKIVPLVETHDAAMALKEIVNIEGIDEIYIGLNDLHLDMKLNFMFEPLANGLVDELATIIKAAAKPFGFGGIARYGEGVIPGEMVLGEHLRLGSSSVILSRTFHRKSETYDEFKSTINLKEEVGKLISAEAQLKMRSESQISDDQERLNSAVAKFVAAKK
jgi:2-keto-3-deoxy-L-rhamnonate aldolase RhmA